MKIALTADPEIPVPPLFYGGIERIVDMLAQGLTEQGHEVTLFAHAGSRVSCRLIGWKGRTSHRLSDTFSNAKTLYQWARKEKFDIIHSFGRLAYLLPLLPSKIPKIMSYQREPSLGQISKAARLSKKDSLLFTGCSNYITNQIKTVATAITVYNAVPANKYIPVYNISEDAPLVFLGRIEPIKGTHLAIEVARKTGKRLIIAGNIPADGKEYFEKEIKPFLDDSIIYIGPVNDDQKNKLLGEACAFLMPIQWNEPFGIVMAEAMACGTPVLGFPYGSMQEVIQDGINGFICQDINDMILKVGQIKKINRVSVRQIAEEKFSNTVIVKKYLDIYTTMIEKAKTIKTDNSNSFR
jgi:glycosyltransferase involved in cell wall biosynthesis